MASGLLKGPSALPAKATFDYVVVGAGGAGCVIAAGLARKFPDAKVALLEAGPAPTGDFVKCPGMAKYVRHLWPGRHYRRGVVTAKQSACENRGLTVTTACGLGGASLINDCVYLRGHCASTEGWGEGWGEGEQILAYKVMEANAVWRNDDHGTDGPWSVSNPPRIASGSALGQSLVNSSRAMGLPGNADFNADPNGGYGVLQHTTRRGTRQTTYDAFVAPALGECPNLTVVPEAHVNRVRFAEGTARVEGVSLSHRSRSGALGAEVDVGVAKECVVACGGVWAPALLQRSGVGPGEHLRRLGITPVVDNEAVGDNLCDLPSVPFSYRSSFTTPSRALSVDTARYLVSHWREWKRDRQGWFAGNVEFTSMLPSSRDERLPDVRVDLWDSLCAEGPDHDAPGLGRGHTLRARIIRPSSRGQTYIAGSDPARAPVVDPRVMSTAADVHRMTEAAAWAQLLSAPKAGLTTVECVGSKGPEHPFHVYDPRPQYPGEFLESAPFLKEYVQRHVSLAGQPTGTCALGTVVDPQLRVTGTEGLRVAGSAIVPVPMGGEAAVVSAMTGIRWLNLVE